MEKTARKKSYRGEIAIFPIMWKMAGFRKMAKGGQRESLPNSSFLEETSKGEKNRKFESYDTPN